MNTKIIVAALRTSGHYLDITEKTLYVTTSFEKKSNVYGTVEYKMVNDILAAFPDVQMVVQKNKRKETISYELMEQYIRIMPDAAACMKEYERVKLRSHAFRSPYKYVVEWFTKQYPNYGSLLVKDENGNMIWDALDNYKKAAVEADARAVAKAAETAVENQADALSA